MKRRTDNRLKSDIDRNVLKFLEDHGYRETTQHVMKGMDTQKFELNYYRTLMKHRSPSLILNKNMNRDANLPRQFSALKQFIHRNNELYRGELEQVLYPIFAHTFLFLVKQGKTHDAQKFLRKYQSEFLASRNKDYMEQLSRIRTLDDLYGCQYARRLLTQKVFLSISKESFELLLRFFEDNQQFIFKSFANRYLNFVVSAKILFPNRKNRGMSTVTAHRQYYLQQQKLRQLQLQQQQMNRNTSSNQQQGRSNIQPPHIPPNMVVPPPIQGGQPPPPPPPPPPHHHHQQQQQQQHRTPMTPQSRRGRGQVRGPNTPQQRVAPPPPLVTGAGATPTPMVYPSPISGYPSQTLSTPSAGVTRYPPSAFFNPFGNHGPPSHPKGSIPPIYELPRPTDLSQPRPVPFRRSQSVLPTIQEHEEKFSPSITLYTYLQYKPNALHISPNLIASSNPVGTVQVHWLSSLKNANELVGHSGPVYGIDCVTTASNIWLLSSSQDSTVRLWNVNRMRGCVVYRGHQFVVWDVAFSSLNRTCFVSASHDKTARFWVTNRATSIRIFAGHLSDVDCVQFHPNSNFVASGSNDKTIRLWDVQSGDCCRILMGHETGVTRLQFHPSGHMLVSGDESGEVIMWDLRMGKKLFVMDDHFGGISEIKMSPKNPSICFTAGLDSSLKMWSLSKRKLLSSFHTKTTNIYSVKVVKKKNIVLAAGVFNK